uniref:Replication factor A C-terminal domain-containing protein n=1 Tax=Quercus lobata TaxID=97700 RepID=A0A7N2LHY0_QUELO
MWDAINIASNHDLISLDMILVDKEETLIHASIRKNLAQTYPTSISKFSGIDHSIPQFQFEFADYGTIASRCYDNTYLSDVIGILDYIGAIEEIKTRGRPTKIRNIQLLLEELNTTIDVNVKEILPKRLLKVQDEELASQNKKTVAEIKNLEWNSETKDLMVTCNAKIININNKYGWYYVACLICKTKVKQVKGVLWCERCKNEPKFAVPSYRIQVEVQDETGSTTFILFDKGAEKIISKTAKELAEMQEEILKLDENILPKEIQKIIGNKYLFQLHLDEYNLKYGKEDYTVSKILDMEISHKQNDSCKVEEHQNILEEIVRKPKKDKYIAGQKIEIGETSVERSELTAPTTTEDGRTGHKRMPLQMLQKRQKDTRQNASKKKKF